MSYLFYTPFLSMLYGLCSIYILLFTFHIVSHSISLSCLYEAMAHMQPCIAFYSELSPLLLLQPTYILDRNILLNDGVQSYHYRHKLNLKRPSMISHLTDYVGVRLIVVWSWKISLNFHLWSVHTLVHTATLQKCNLTYLPTHYIIYMFV